MSLKEEPTVRDSVLLKKWYEEMEVGLLQKHISSMPARIKAVIKARGGVIKY